MTTYYVPLQRQGSWKDQRCCWHTVYPNIAAKTIAAVDPPCGTEETEVRVGTKAHFGVLWRTKQSIDI